MRTPWVAMVASLVALAGCGSAPSLTTPPAISSTPHAQTTLTPTAAPTTVPLPPLAVIRVGTALVAVDDTGKVQWNLTQANMDAMLSAGTQNTIAARVAGPDVFLSVIATNPACVGRLVVLDGTGTSIGGGSFAPVQCQDDVFGGPTGSEWAYSVDDSPTATTRHHGRIVVAGIGMAPHTVYSWVAPVGFLELVGGWTDMGIVMKRIGPGGCGLGFHDDNATFLIDPVNGALSDLFSGSQHYGDVRHHVAAGFASSASAVLVDGVTFDEPGTVANAVYVSPDGARVGVQRFVLGGCAGDNSQQTIRTELIDVAAGAHTDVAGCGITGWFDAGRFVCTAFGDTTQHLESLSGQGGPILGNGDFVGVLTSA